MALIIPEVFANAINERMGVKLRVGKLATDCTNMVDAIETYGDTVHFPTIDRIADAAVVTKGTPLTPNTVSMTDATATIKQVANSTRIFDKENVQVKDELKNKLAKQLADSMAKAVDSDFVKEMLDNATYVDDTVTTLTEGAVDAAFDVFGDDVDNDTFAGIVISSNLRKAFMGMDAFISSTKTNAVYGNGVVIDGCIGYWNGTIPVYVTNNGTKITSNGVNKDVLAVIKKDALGIIWQKQPTVEEQRPSLLLATDIIASEMYATKLMRADGVSILKVGGSAGSY